MLIELAGPTHKIITSDTVSFTVSDCFTSARWTALHRARCASKARLYRALTDDQLTRLGRERVGFVFQFFNLLPTLTTIP